MAKRKRLAPAKPTETPPLEHKSMFPSYRDGWEGVRAPIAQVAGDAAASAALAELTDQVAQARETGRMVLDIPLEAIDPAYLVRDRLVVDDAEMQSLMSSITARGQQTPIEVAALDAGRYGLISGWRRLEALKRLAAQGDTRPVLALLRRPDDAADAYLAMVEENEIRVGLSYFERARIAAVAVDQKVFATEKEALLKIYHAASRAKRSKIRSFLSIVRKLDGALAFPAALNERLGLTLARALEQQSDLAATLRMGLKANPAKTPEEESARISAAISSAQSKPAPEQSLKVPLETKKPSNLPRGVQVKTHPDGRLTLSGPGFTPEMRQRLFDWLALQ